MQFLTHIHISKVGTYVPDKFAQGPQHTTQCHDYTAVARRPNNEWTPMQRVILHWLATTFSNAWTDVCSIFNACFKEELPTQQGLSANALRAMLHSMKLQTDEKEALAALQSTSSSAKSVGFENVVYALVKRTASELDIKLIKQEGGTTSRATNPRNARIDCRKKRRATERNFDTSSDDSGTVPCDGSDREVFPPMVAKRLCTPRTRSIDRSGGLLSPPSTQKAVRHQNFVIPRPSTTVFPTRHKESLTDWNGAKIPGTGSPSPPGVQELQVPMDGVPMPERKGLPRLAFRAFTPSSMGVNTGKLFVAGAFASMDPESIPPPPDPSHPDYRDAAIRHVARIHTGPTEFISTSRNLLRCLHRALKSQQTSSIAVIDLHVLSSLNLVQSASSLKLQVNHRYIPIGEYLVYGTIPEAAIVSCTPTARLLEVMPTMPGDDDPFQIEALHSMERVNRAAIRPLPMSSASGAAVGMLGHALKIPFRLMRNAVWSITTDWRFEEARKWQNNEVFCEGVERGYRSRQSGRFMSLDIDDVANYTEVEQSDDGSQTEASSPNRDWIQDWKVEDPPSNNDEQSSAVNFMAELQRAVERDDVGLERTKTNEPFRCALDVPEITYEEEEAIFDAGQDNDNVGDQEEEYDIVNQHCGFAELQYQGDYHKAPMQKPEERYEYSWTGM